MRAGLTPEEQARVVALARSWIGTPFHPHARQRGVGVDCAQLLVAVYSEAGLMPAIRVPRLPADWHLHSPEEHYLRTLRMYAAPVRAPWAAGDILVYRGAHWPSAGHAGIYVGDGRIVHAVAARGRGQDRVGGVQEWPTDTPLLATACAGAWRWRR